MPSRTEAMSCCPVCMRDDINARPIESAVPYNSASMFENRTNKDSAVFFNCPACGEYVATECDCVNLKSDPIRAEWDPLHISSLLREQTVSQLPSFWLRTGIMEPYGSLNWADRLVHIDVNELLQRWPRTVGERIDRTLCNFVALSHHGGDRVTIRSSVDNPLAFAQNIGEAIFHRSALVDSQLVEVMPPEPGSSNIDIVVTSKGWARFEDLTRGKSDEQNPVFVAMWFGGESDTQRQAMDDTFKRGIVPAVEQAGYRAVRSDLVEHNDWIMDKILGDIRRAPFIISDFTQHRNGVYYEAGFARGLGISVIHTCRSDELGNAHFDTAQMNHVVWESTEELCKKLYHRIVGSIGLGPYPPPK